MTPRLLFLALLLPAPLAAAEWRLDARTLWEHSITRDVRLSADNSALELEEGELFEDDGPAAGFSYQPNDEKLSERVRLKKELMIPDPRARQATLLVGPGGNLRALINGKPVELQRVGKAGQYWDAYRFSPEVLRAGTNEIVLHGTGRIWIARADEFAAGSPTRTQPPKRSAKSTDGGQTWHYDRLGTQGTVAGEYYVRVFLDRYRAGGEVTLPVVDIGNLSERPVAPPLAGLGPVRVRVAAETGNSGHIRLRMRSGTTPAPAAAGWSAWQTFDALSAELPQPRGRFLQVAVELTTRDPLQTPRLQHVHIETAPRLGDDWGERCKEVQRHNEGIVRSSIPFAYEPFTHPRLQQLRTQYRLEEVVKEAKDEIDLMARLARWTAQQWEGGHLKEIYPPWDALEILKPYRDGKPVGGFCQQYNLVLLQACESFGIPGRPVSLGVGDHGGGIKGGGHEVVELWSNQFKKWVYVDGNTAWYLVDAASKTPLSLWELRQRQLQLVRGEKFQPVEPVHLLETSKRWAGLDSWPPFLELRLIPRSNFLEQPTPIPLNQGMRGWFWTGHYVWTDAVYPASLLYGQRVSQRRNFEWTLNQARFYLEATATPGELRVHLDTETPSFATFLARIDDGPPQPVASGFLWKLHPGRNRLQVLPRNTAGREGIASWVVLDYR